LAREALLAATGDLCASVVALETPEEVPRSALAYAIDCRDQLHAAIAALEKLGVETNDS
jgi:hypothetical protein